LIFSHDNPSLQLVSNAEDLLEVYRLRSEIYEDIGFKNECIDPIEGLNFDNFDHKSAILHYKTNNTITGTTRVILDSHMKLPTDEKFSFDEYRKNYKQLAELSRAGIRSKSDGLSTEFKYLTSGVYNICQNNGIDFIVSGMKYEHYKLYKKFGGVELAHELGNYGKIEGNFFITTWNPKEITPFFKKIFL
jgi:N-acyl-L-homoserine lactone synthetase